MPQPQAVSALVTPEQVLKSLGAIPEADRYVAALGIYRSGRKELLAGIFSLGSPEAEALFQGTLKVVGKSHAPNGASFAYQMGRKVAAARIYYESGADLAAARIWKELGENSAAKESYEREIEKRKADILQADGSMTPHYVEQLVGVAREADMIIDAVQFLEENSHYAISAKVREELGQDEKAREDWERAAEIALIKDDHSQAAEAFKNAGKPEKAKEASLREALKHEIKKEYAWAAQAYKRALEPEKARANWRKTVEQLRGRGGDKDKEYAVKVAAEHGFNDLALEICMERHWYRMGVEFAEALGNKEQAAALEMLDALTSDRWA